MMALYHRDVHGGGRTAGRRQPHRAAGPPHRVGHPGLRPARDRPRPGGQPPRRQRPAQRLPHRRRQVAGHLQCVARTSPCGSTGPSAAPTWPRTPTTWIRSAGRSERSRSTSSWPSGSAERTLDEAMAVFEAAAVAAAPIYDAEQLLADEHLRARGTFVTGGRSGPRADDRAGPGRGPAPRHRDASTTSGRHLGADNDGRLRRPARRRPRPARRPSGRRASSDRATMEAAVREPRARRSELATPASSERMCEKAARSGADLVFLDLEDACAPSAKESARGIAVAALTGCDWGRTVRAVRVNGLDTPVVPRRHHRGRHRRPGVARRAHRAQGAARPATSGGSTCSSPSWRPSSA